MRKNTQPPFKSDDLQTLKSKFFGTKDNGNADDPLRTLLAKKLEGTELEKYVKDIFDGLSPKLKEKLTEYLQDIYSNKNRL